MLKDSLRGGPIKGNKSFLSGMGMFNFSRAKQLLDEKGSEYLKRSIVSIDAALKMLYGTGEISLQQLAATFRRGDLIEILARIEE